MCCQAMGETFLVASAPCVSPVLSWCSRSLERIEALYKMMQLAIRRLHSAQSSCSYSVLKRSLPKPKRVAGRARISQEVTPHVLRHTFATLAIQKGISLAAIQKILGHDRLGTTAIYLNLTDTHVVDEYSQKW